MDFGLIEDTIIVILSDHGESFGEHNWWGHGATLYTSELEVPLIVSYPTKLSSRTIKQTFSLAYLPDLILMIVQGKTPSEVFDFVKGKEGAYAEIFEPVIYIQRMEKIYDNKPEYLYRGV